MAAYLATLAQVLVNILKGRYNSSFRKNNIRHSSVNTTNLTTVKAVIGDRYVIYEAMNGVEGIEMAKKVIPDFILMDIALPQLDGIQSFKVIRSNPHLMQIPVLALTASAMLSDRETILAHGFDAYIPKPIDEKQFFEIINTVLYGN